MFDEAYNAWDAVRLRNGRHLTPFLAENNGREAGYHYWLIPFLSGIVETPSAVRVRSTMLGILTISVMYPLGKALFNRHVAFWSTAALSVFYWHIHTSQLGLRAISQPLVGMLAFTLLWWATKHNRQRDWVWAGVATGTLIYTYFSARLWILFVGVWLVAIWWRHSEQRRGALTTLIVTSIVCLPQLSFTYFNPSASLDRIRTVAVSQQDIITNLQLWAGAWFHAGDRNTFLNLANRPIFDLPLGTLCIIGIIALAANRRSHTTLFWLLSLLSVSLLSSILSDNAPHFLRAVGGIVPLTLLIGVGAATIAKQQTRVPYIWVLPLLLLGASMVRVVQDQTRWIQRDDRFITMEMPVNRATRWVDENIDSAENIYYTPYNPFHPNVAFHTGRLRDVAPHIGAFAPSICAIVPDGEALYINITPYSPDFAAAVSDWSDLTPLDRIVDEIPLVDIYAGQSRLDETLVQTDQPITFIDKLTLRHTPLPQQVAAGGVLPFALAFRATQPLPAVYSAFVHLHGNPSPYEGGVTWAQVDSWLCESYQSPEWQPHETIVQRFDLAISAETPPGTYDVAVGIYESPSGPRIELTYPGNNPNQFVIIGSVEVIAATE